MEEEPGVSFHDLSLKAFFPGEGGSGLGGPGVSSRNF